MYLLVIQRVPGLMSTIITSNDVNLLRQVLEDSKKETYKTPDGTYHEVQRARVFHVDNVNEDWSAPRVSILPSGNKEI